MAQADECGDVANARTLASGVGNRRVGFTFLMISELAASEHSGK